MEEGVMHAYGHIGHYRESKFFYSSIVIIFGIIVVGTICIGLEHARRKGYEQACDDMKGSLSHSENCSVVLQGGACKIECFTDAEFRESEDFSKLHDPLIDQMIQQQWIEAQNKNAEVVPCRNIERKDSLIVHCPGTRASPFPHSVIVPKR